ncbi:MAG: glycosyltransferase [Capnocytophaga sp.]|nr:glycosyltransferase [Capnocytophaga sp.]
MKEISFLVGLKNNLSYTKSFYDNVRLLYPDNEIVFVSFGSTDGTHQWLDSLNDPNLIYFYSEENKTLSDTYNKATELATKPFVAFLHNDMLLGKHFLEQLSDAICENHLYYYSLIEPPIFGEDKRDWKMVENFGEDFHSFDFEAFYKRENAIISDEKLLQTNDVCFFLCINRQILLNIRGLDPIFAPMFCEDDDLIFRLKLLGLESFVVKNAIAYHFVSKTSRFSDEYKNKTQIIEGNSHRNFVRKWGFFNFSKSKAKYDIGIILKNGNKDLLAKIEPLSSVIYIDFDPKEYIAEEQPKTKINLQDKIKSLKNIENHDVMISVNGKGFNHKTEYYLKNLADIITDRIKEQKYKTPKIKQLIYRWFKPYKLEITINKNTERKEKTLIIRDAHSH